MKNKRTVRISSKYFTIPLYLSILRIIYENGGRITKKELAQKLAEVYGREAEQALSNLSKTLISLEVRGLITTFFTGRDHIIELVRQKRFVNVGED